METSLNTYSEKEIIPIERLSSIITEMNINLIKTSERTKEDKEELEFLKEEFLKNLSALINKKEIPNINIAEIGNIYEAEILVGTSANTMLRIYKSLKDYYKTTKTTLTIQEGKSYLTKTLESSAKPNTEENQIPKKINTFKNTVNIPKLGMWEMVSETIDIPNLSLDNVYEVFSKFNYEKYSSIQLIQLIEDLKNIKNAYKMSLIDDTKDAINYIIKSIKDYLEDSQEKNKKNLKLESKEYVESLFFQNIFFIEDFILQVHTEIENQGFHKYANIQDLKNDHNYYNDFLSFRKELLDKYENNVYKKYEYLFKKDSTIDNYFYNSILSELKRIGDGFSPKVSDLKIFLGIKNQFILGDLYEFLLKQINDTKNNKIELSQLLSKELSNYVNKEPINI